MLRQGKEFSLPERITLLGRPLCMTWMWTPAGNTQLLAVRIVTSGWFSSCLENIVAIVNDQGSSSAIIVPWFFAAAL